MLFSNFNADAAEITRKPKLHPIKIWHKSARAPNNESQVCAPVIIELHKKCESTLTSYDYALRPRI